MTEPTPSETALSAAYEEWRHGKRWHDFPPARRDEVHGGDTHHRRDAFEEGWLAAAERASRSATEGPDWLNIHAKSPEHHYSLVDCRAALAREGRRTVTVVPVLLALRERREGRRR